MFIVDISNPVTLLLMLIATVLLTFLGREIKKSSVVAIALFIYLILVIVHVVQLLVLPEELKNLVSVLTKCIVLDLVFIFITFFAYLWTDDTEAKIKGKKSYDNSLEWFWKNV